MSAVPTVPIPARPTFRGAAISKSVKLPRRS
jgi:hypothetical protein